MNPAGSRFCLRILRSCQFTDAVVVKVALFPVGVRVAIVRLDGLEVGVIDDAVEIRVAGGFDQRDQGIIRLTPGASTLGSIPQKPDWPPGSASVLSLKRVPPACCQSFIMEI